LAVILRSPTRQSLRRSGYGAPGKAESHGDGAKRRRICPSWMSRSFASLRACPELEDTIRSEEGSGSRGRLPSPSSHGTGLVDLTSGSSGCRSSERSVIRHRCRHPQLSQLQSELEQFWGNGSGPHQPTVFQRDQSPLGEVRLVEGSMQRRSLAQIPRAASAVVDRLPRGLLADPELDESSHDRAPSLPLLQEQCSESAPDMGVQIVQRSLRRLTGHVR
jgi:hypothetical protein